jgi:hypothetical protein
MLRQHWRVGRVILRFGLTDCLLSIPHIRVLYKCFAYMFSRKYGVGAYMA